MAMSIVHNLAYTFVRVRRLVVSNFLFWVQLLALCWGDLFVVIVLLMTNVCEASENVREELRR